MFVTFPARNKGSYLTLILFWDVLSVLQWVLLPTSRKKLLPLSSGFKCVCRESTVKTH
jgi:hypothetical protein